MKTSFRIKILITVLLPLLLSFQTSIGEDVEIPTSSIKIDEHWIYIFQQNDLKTLRVEEYFFINNTGNTVFNDSISIWIQNNTLISAECCDDIPNMACRYKEGGYMSCFNLTYTGDNLYVGYPISSENKLSYYGQKEQLTITAFSATNSSLKNDTLHWNVTIGGASIQRENESIKGVGIHITSEIFDIGLRPSFSLNMPFNITAIDMISVLNNGTENETIHFNISNLPQGWTAQVWDHNIQVNNISLPPKEYVNLTLLLLAPTYLAPIYVGYTTPLEVDDNENTGIFTKQYLYETPLVQYLVYIYSNDGLKISEDLTMVHPFSGEKAALDENYQRYWYLAQAKGIQPNSITTIDISLEETSIQSQPFSIWLLIIIVFLIILVLVLKKKGFFGEKKIDATEELLKEKKTLQEKIKQIKSDLSLGIIDEKSSKKMKKDYQNQLEEIDKALKEVSDREIGKKQPSRIGENQTKIEKRLKDLQEQKKKVLSAIKRVERKFKNGAISKKDYERFRAAYKKRAVEILKEIDQLKEKK